MDCNGVDGFIVLICCRLHEYSVTELALVNMENQRSGRRWQWSL